MTSYDNGLHNYFGGMSTQKPSLSLYVIILSWHLHQICETDHCLSLKVVAGVVALTVAVVCSAYFYRKYRERRQGPGPDTQKRGFFDRLFASRKSKGDQYEPTSGEDTVENGTQSHRLNPTSSRRNVEQTRGGRNNRSSRLGNRNSTRNNNNTAAVDRNTSVRSVMTLPPYNPMAGTNEQVLGREGERDGVDVIIDLPTAEEDEALREDEMETLYQIRVNRRQQIAEREARREQRREARRRHDSGALNAIRAQTVAANNDTTIRDLRSDIERIKENRQRSVSSVSYADLGIARHDGTRIRANSTESERVGLLSDAASITQTQSHQRGRSGSSVASIDSDFPPTIATTTRSRGDSTSNLSRMETREGRAGSSPELVEADLGDETMPPPEYEDISLDDARSITPPHNEPPPDYSGPYRSASTRTERDLASRGQDDNSNSHSRDSTPSSGRGVGGVPQLPSLRIPPPQIVIEPSSAHPRDEEQPR